MERPANKKNAKSNTEQYRDQKEDSPEYVLYHSGVSPLSQQFRNSVPTADTPPQAAPFKRTPLAKIIIFLSYPAPF